MPNVVQLFPTQAAEEGVSMIATVLTGAEIALWVDRNEEIAQALLDKIIKAFAEKQRLIYFTVEEMQVYGPYLQWSSREELKQKLKVLLNL